MVISERSIEQRLFVSKLADTLLFDVDEKPLPSIAILRHVQQLVGSLIVEFECQTHNGLRLGDSTANGLVIRVLKEVNGFAQTPEEGVVLKKRLIEILVDNSVAEYERVYLLQRIQTT